MLCRGCSTFGRAHQRFVCFELGSQFIFGQRAVLHLGTLIWGLADRSRVETEFDFLATLVVGNIRCRDAFHTEDFDLVAVAAREGVLDARETITTRELDIIQSSGKCLLFRLELVDLLDMHC